MHRAPPAFCRLTVLAPGRRVDVALPVDVPVAELVPMVLELLGEPARSPRAPGAVALHRRRPAAPLPAGRHAGRARRARRGDCCGSARPLRPRRRRCSTTRSTRWRRSAPRGRHGRRGPAVAARRRDVAGGRAAGDRPRRRAAAPRPWAAGRARRSGRVAALVRAATVARRAAGTADAPAAHRPGRARAGAAPVADGPAAALVPPSARYRSPRRPAGPRSRGRPAPPTCCSPRWRPAPPPRSARSPCGRWRPCSSPPCVVAVLTGAAAVAAAALRRRRPRPCPPPSPRSRSRAGPLLPRAVLRLAGLPRPVVPRTRGALVAADAGPDLLSARRAGRPRPPGPRPARRPRPAASRWPPRWPRCRPPLSGGWAGPGAGRRRGRRCCCCVPAGSPTPAPARVHLVAGIAAGVALVGLGAVAAGPAGRPVGALVLLGAAGVTAIAGARRGDGRRRCRRWPAGPWTSPRASSPRPRSPSPSAAAGVFALVRGL